MVNVVKATWRPKADKSTPPMHLVDIFAANDGPRNYSDTLVQPVVFDSTFFIPNFDYDFVNLESITCSLTLGMYLKNTSPYSSTSNNSQGNLLRLLFNLDV